jgi:hypothetical protein
MQATTIMQKNNQRNTISAGMDTIPENKYNNNYMSNPKLDVVSNEPDYEALMSESEAKRRNKGVRTSALAGGSSPASMMSPKSTVASDRRRKAK